MWLHLQSRPSSYFRILQRDINNWAPIRGERLILGEETPLSFKLPTAISTHFGHIVR